VNRIGQNRMGHQDALGCQKIDYTLLLSYKLGYTQVPLKSTIPVFRSWCNVMLNLS